MIELYLIFSVLFWVSIIAFGLYGFDKHLAVYQRSRVPEAVLFVVGALGGAFGALMGMLLFRHKTQKVLFWILNLLFLALHVTGIILLGCLI